MNNNKTVVRSSSGISFCSLLTITFIILKLCKVISWGWFWVLSPMIFGLGLGLIVVIIAVLAKIFLD